MFFIEVWVDEELMCGILGWCEGCVFLFDWSCFLEREEMLVEVIVVEVVKRWVGLGKIEVGGGGGGVMIRVLGGVGRVMGEL